MSFIHLPAKKDFSFWVRAAFYWFALIACTNGMAQATTCPPAATPIAPESIPEKLSTATDKGFLYSFSRNGQTSWLYGTVHVGNENTFFPGPVLLATLKNSTALALELDLSNPTALVKTVQEFSDSAKNKQLQTPNRMAAIATAAASGCVPAENLKSQPLILQAMALIANEAKYAGLFPEYSQESMLTGFAIATNKKIFALETMSEQLDALLGESTQDAGELIDEILTDLKLPKTIKSMTDVVDVWRDSNLTKLNSYYDWCDCVNNERERALMYRLTDNRNKIMLNRMIRLHENNNGQLFVGVGSLHLIGETGLVQMLEKSNYVVKRLY